MFGSREREREIKIGCPPSSVNEIPKIPLGLEQELFVFLLLPFSFLVVSN